MRRMVILAAIVALLAFALRQYWLPLVPPGWLDGGTAPSYLGYVEGETALIASPSAGRLIARYVSRGQRVPKGTILFRLDPAVAEAEVARTEASVAEAKAQHQNLLTGKRGIEQDIVRAQLREAEAAMRFAEVDLQRAMELFSNNAATQSRVDQAHSTLDQAKARVQQMRSQVEAGELGGRNQEIAAAEARVREAQAQFEQAKSRLRDLMPEAPQDGLVENTFFDAGEWVGAGQPVLSLLPDNQVKLRFFVPEEDVAKALPGRSITFTCDGCAGKAEAMITYVSPRSEYTPPVIYSQSARQKLVFLVEARPKIFNPSLRPGLPVDVDALGLP